MPERREFVVFYSPGTLVAETSGREVPSRDLAEAVRIAEPFFREGPINRGRG